jgi:membrane-bound ClpP family serine protease
LQSKKIVGFLWLLAGVLMMLPSLLSEGKGTFVGVGIMFLIFGIVTLSRDRKN